MFQDGVQVGRRGSSVMIADIEEQVRRPVVVTVLHELDERKPKQALVDLNRLLDVGADERGVVDSAPRRLGTVSGGHDVVRPEFGAAVLELDELGICGRHRVLLDRSDTSAGTVPRRILMSKPLDRSDDCDQWINTSISRARRHRELR